MQQPTPRPATPEEKLRSAAQQIRAGVNEAGVGIVQAGFEAIDEVAAHATTKLKNSILELLTGKKK